MRMEKIKSVVEGHGRLRHMRKEIPCKTARDPSGKHYVLTFNSNETAANQKKTFREIFREKTAGQPVRKNAVYAVEVMLTFSPGALDPNSDIMKEWAGANMRWLANTFGGKENIIDGRLHMDETTAHIHAMVIPIDDRGKLNARAFLGGTSHRMSELQTDYAKAMEPFDLVRGISREITGAKHQSHLRWEADHAEKEASLQAYKEMFGDMLSNDLDLRIEFSKRVTDALKDAPESVERLQDDLNHEIG